MANSSNNAEAHVLISLLPETPLAFQQMHPDYIHKAKLSVPSK